ncbi:MAG: hypothetical protein KF690_05215 [Bacteroidetes bacterium]|nr:hypothetical protein [Bacteroidota bacterium]
MDDLTGELDTTCSLLSRTTAGLVRLYADPRHSQLVNEGYTARVRLRIYFSVTDSLDDTLVVRYDPAAHVEHAYLAYRRYTHIDSIRFKVLSVSVTWDNTGTGVPANLVLEGEFSISQYIKYHQPSFKTTELLGRKVVENIHPYQYISTTNELRVSWDPICGVDAYELEWTYVDAFSSASGTNNVQEDPSTVRFNFYQNATRVRLEGLTTYDIPLLYELGYLAYRYRPVLQDTVAGTIQEFGGPWSTFRWSNFTFIGSSPPPADPGFYYNYGSDTGYSAAQYPDNDFRLSLFSEDYLFRINAAISHEDSLGWQAATTFAEEAKRKSVVSYFDGSLRNRQTVTYNNQDTLVIVTETIYDYHGRPAVQILPAPVVGGGTQSISHAIRYFEAFNRVAADTGFTAQHFAADVPGSGCDASPDTLYSGTGASLYYSPRNQRQTTYQAFLPDAEGYPLTITEFTPDNTGRIKRQSGVGKAHQLGTHHETRHFYGTPAVHELQRLFGSNFGHISHYFKNMVVDPNSTTTISYVDMHGRTIATAMAGSADTNLVNLPANSQHTEYTVVNLDSSSVLVEDSLAYVLNKSFLVPARGWYFFDYTITAGDITDSLCGLCYNCVYDLSISITDNACGAEYLNGAAGVRHTIGSASFGCGLSPDSVQSFTMADSVFLEAGAYTLVKKLRINPDSLNKYVQRFTVENECIATLEDFLDDAYAEIDTAECIKTCAACDTLYGTQSEFIEQYTEQILVLRGDEAELTPDDTLAGLAQYQKVVADCRRLYCPGYESECYTNLQAMIADVSPGGQYFTYTVSESGVYAVPPSSLFSVLRTGAYNHASNKYIDYAGIREPFDADTLSVKWFVTNWRTSWADTLVKYHPEYLLYKWCVAMDSSHRYDWSMQQITKYEDAVALGFVNPLDLDATTTPGLPTQNDSLDPFFDEIVATFGCPGIKTSMQNDLRNFTVAGYPASGNTYWEQAAINVNCPHIEDFDYIHCKNNPKNKFGASATDTLNDRQWDAFRALYLWRKRYWIERCRTECTGSLFLPDNRPQLRAYGFRLNFPQADDVYRGYTYIDEDGVPQSTGITSTPPTTQAGYAALANEKLAEQCNLFCASQLPGWLNDFEGCLNVLRDTSSNWRADSAAIADGFMEVCLSGCDGSNPFGAGTLPVGVFTVSGYNSFQDVIDTVFAQYYDSTEYRTVTCDPYLINQPPAYGSNLFPEAPMQPADACACDKVTSLYAYYVADAELHDTLAFTAFINDSLQTAFTDLQVNELLCACTNTCMTSLTQDVYNYFSLVIDEPGAAMPLKIVNINDTLDLVFTTWGYLDVIPPASENSAEIIAHWVNRKDRTISQSKAYYLDSVSHFIPAVYKDMEDSSIVLLATGASTTSRIVKISYDGDLIWHKKVDHPLDTIPWSASHLLWNALHIERVHDDYVLLYKRNYWMRVAADGSGVDAAKLHLDNAYATIPWDYSHVLADSLLGSLTILGGNTYMLVNSGTYTVEDSSNHIISILKLDPTSNLIDTTVSFRLNNLPDSSVYGAKDSSFANGRIIRDWDSTLIVAIPVVDTLFTGDSTYHHSIANRATGLLLIRLDTNLNILHHKRFFVENDWTETSQLPDSTVLYRGFATLNNLALHTTLDGSLYVKTALLQLQNSYGDSTSSRVFLDNVLWKLDRDFNTTYLKSILPPVLKDSLLNHEMVTQTNAFTFGGMLSYTAFSPNADLSVLDFSLLQDSTGAFDYEYNPLYAVFPANGNLPGCYSGTYRLRTEQLPILPDSLTFSVEARPFSLTDFTVLVKDTTISYLPTGCRTIQRKPRPLASSEAHRGGELPMPWVPRELTCSTCLTCDTVNAIWQQFWADTLYQQMAEEAPGNSKIALYNYLNRHFRYSLSVSDYEAFLDACPLNPDSLLCNRSAFERTDNRMPDEDDRNDCIDIKKAQAQLHAQRNYDLYIQALEKNFRQQYVDTCLRTLSGFSETFTMRYRESEYHYTLYYYDQAGNLVQTVPPVGVDTVAQNHTLKTTYTYNSLNQVVKQHSPDADTTWLAYDQLGRLIISMSARQYAQSLVMGDTSSTSYTLYDPLNRIIETGQVRFPIAPAAFVASLQGTYFHYETFSLAITLSNARTQYTQTIYDTLAYAIPGQSSQNLRGRITHITTHAPLAFGTDPGSPYAGALHYSYDIHGNVRRLITDMPGLGQKTLDYTYDLISGNVHRVVYQDSAWDYWAHRYEYDADNRLRRAYTSTDGVHWWQDARYHYYQHGPLARAEIGHYQVQGMDYLYTLHGWIKGVNSPSLQQQHDPGQDGYAGPNLPFALDAAAYNLSYYRDSLNGWNDYRPIGAVSPLPAVPVPSWLHQAAPSLYNGNIRHMVTAHAKDFGGGMQAHASAYRYDQLNRIVRADHALAPLPMAGSGTWAGVARTASYFSDYTYDPNGNLRSLHRNGNKTSPDTLMDYMHYLYYPGTNRLSHINDTVADMLYMNDIDDQDTLNYTYDRSGNLVKDASRGIDSIEWNLQGKVARVIKGSSQIKYKYDPMGQRILKQFIQDMDTINTYYLRDAQGNVLAIYKDTTSVEASPCHENIDTLRLRYIQQLYTLTRDNLFGGNEINNKVAYVTNFHGSQPFYTYKRDTAYALDCGLEVPADSADRTAFLITQLYGFPSNPPRLDCVIELYARMGTTQFTGRQMDTLLALEPALNFSREDPLLCIKQEKYAHALAENHIYGSSRLGIQHRTIPYSQKTYSTVYNPFSDTWSDTVYLQQGIPKPVFNDTNTVAYLGQKHYELTNHLGNVLATFTDRKLGIDSNTVADGVIDLYIADLVSAQDYYPFGMTIPGRVWQDSTYRFGFAGKEKEAEIGGNTHDFGGRMYEGERWWSVDPKAAKYPGVSPYVYALNSPIMANDPNGEEVYFVVNVGGKYVTIRARDSYDIKAKFVEAYSAAKGVPGFGHLLEKYENSRTHDVYFVFNQTDWGYTVPDAQRFNELGRTHRTLFSLDETAFSNAYKHLDPGAFGNEQNIADQYGMLEGVQLVESYVPRNVSYSIVVMPEQLLNPTEGDQLKLKTNVPGLKQASPKNAVAYLMYFYLHEVAAHVEKRNMPGNPGGVHNALGPSGEVEETLQSDWDKSNTDDKLINKIKNTTPQDSSDE